MVEYRRFGQTDMELSTIGLGGLLARYEGVNGHPPPEEKRRIYLRAAELGVNLFDMGLRRRGPYSGRAERSEGRPLLLAQGGCARSR